MFTISKQKMLLCYLRNYKGKTNLDFTEARDSEWQWHQLGHMQVCTSLQTDNHANALHQLSGTHYHKLFSVVTLLQFLSLH